MATLTLSPEAALQPRFLEGIINKKLENMLTFGNYFPVVRTDALSFSYFEDLIFPTEEKSTPKVSHNSPYLSELGNARISP
jgi:hypothetical protein